jgi:hypothetical protein
VTLLLGAALALSACGPQDAGAAAIVNGTVISDQDVQTITGQLNTISPDGQKLSSSNALLSLILEPYVLAEAARVDKVVVSAADARKVIAKVANPSPKTIKFVQTQLVIQGLNEASKASIVKEIGKAKITVNPRYGTFDATRVELTPTSPNWIKPSATPSAQ